MAARKDVKAGGATQLWRTDRVAPAATARSLAQGQDARSHPGAPASLEKDPLPVRSGPPSGGKTKALIPATESLVGAQESVPAGSALFRKLPMGERPERPSAMAKATSEEMYLHRANFPLANRQKAVLSHP